MRNILIAIVVVILIALGVGAYFFFTRETPELTPGTPGDPFAGTGAGNVSGNGTTPPEVGVTVSGAGEEVAPQLFKITDGPVAYGVAVFPVSVPQALLGSSTTPLPPLQDVETRYIDRASGNMYRFQLGTRELERLTNQTLPGIQEASFALDGSRAFVRYEVDDRIETYSLPADGSEGYALQSGLSGIVVSATSSVLTVLPGTNGTIGTRATLSGGSPTTVFTSLLGALTVRLSGAGYVAYTKPSRDLPGYAFSIARPTGEFSRVLGPRAGLAILPNPAGTKYLFSAVSGASIETGIIDVATRDVTTLPFQTLVEKCTWSFDGGTVYCAVPRVNATNLPDSWYQGLTTTSDRMWEVDLASRIATLLFDPELIATVEMDVVALSTDSAKQALVFTNKRDGSLWLYDL